MSSSEKATALHLGFVKKMLLWYFSDPVFIYTMGKVGSSSIANTLRRYEIPEVQPHSLVYTKKGSYFVCPNLTVLERAFYATKTMLMKFKVFMLLMKYKLLSREIRIISITRDPVSRNISAFFEQHQYILNKEIDRFAPEELIEKFWRYANHDAPLIWFDRELKKVFDIDVFSEPFPWDKGYKIYKKSNIRCLVIRMEDLAKSESVIADFLSLPSFSLMPTNRAEKKAYSSAYSNFKEKVAIPEEYINKMYNSKYTRHFYSDSEITKFKQKWCA